MLIASLIKQPMPEFKAVLLEVALPSFKGFSLFDWFLAAGGASFNQAKNRPADYGFHLCRFTQVEPPFFGWIAAPWQPV
jgi:hypothetical protein